MSISVKIFATLMQHELISRKMKTVSRIRIIASQCGNYAHCGVYEIFVSRFFKNFRENNLFAKEFCCKIDFSSKEKTKKIPQ